MLLHYLDRFKIESVTGATAISVNLYKQTRLTDIFVLVSLLLDSFFAKVYHFQIFITFCLTLLILMFAINIIIHHHKGVQIKTSRSKQSYSFQGSNSPIHSFYPISNASLHMLHKSFEDLWPVWPT